MGHLRRLERRSLEIEGQEVITADNCFPETENNRKEYTDMTLKEFKSVACSMPNSPFPPTIYIFRDEKSAINWTEDKFLGKENRSYDIVGVLCSDYKADVVLNERWSNAEVESFIPVYRDTLVVVVTPYELKEGAE